MNLCWVLMEKQHNLGLHTFKLPTSTKTYFKINQLNMIFDDFSTCIWLLGYRTEFSCLYLPQGHSFISIVWLLNTDEFVKKMILSESPSLTQFPLFVWGTTLYIGISFFTSTTTLFTDLCRHSHSDWKSTKAYLYDIVKSNSM